ncbi:MAG TPA: hypothetical protein GX723_13250, partial [Thermoanaerobacterales bacterium]|nr:hypothetical protein [Thermoanaerobacterales bacterium]
MPFIDDPKRYGSRGFALFNTTIIIFVNIVKFLHKRRIMMLCLKKMCYNGKNIYKEATKMTVSYKKLWKLLIDRDMNKQDLQVLAKISPSS